MYIITLLVEKIKFDRVRRNLENMVKMSWLNGYNSRAGIKAFPGTLVDFQNDCVFKGWIGEI